MRIISRGLLSLAMSACQGSHEPTPAPAQETAQGATADETPKNPEPPAAKSGSPTPSVPSKNLNFYPIKGARPAAVCGVDGFAYLWKGYLVPECGGCHYAGNTFKVDPFADGRSVTSSYEIMSTLVNKQELIAATQANQFCIKCILQGEDPLFADLKFFAANPTVCPAP